MVPVTIIQLLDRLSSVGPAGTEINKNASLEGPELPMPMMMNQDHVKKRAPNRKVPILYGPSGRRLS